MKLRFLGANKQVTGSRYILEACGRRIMIDCGMFQERKYLDRNWNPCPVDASSIDVLLLTHAHLDHCGLIPRFINQGFKGEVLTTAASLDLAEIIMTDAGKIQEEDAAYKKKRHRKEKRKGKHPVQPLYTAEDAENAILRFRSVPYHQAVDLGDNVSATFHDAGHILGSAMLEIVVRENGESRTILFSGDIGQWGKPIIRDPELFDRADHVVMESTYGDRLHGAYEDIETQLAEAINETARAGGNILIPTFAVERAQELTYHLGNLVRDKRIPSILAFLDSPMAVKVTEVFRRHTRNVDDEFKDLLDAGKRVFRFRGMNFIQSVEESKAINQIRGSCVILAGSGMCTAGRIKHHLAQNISKPESSIVFTGYQAHGTLGRLILDGKEVVRIHGQEHKVRARVRQINGLSAHADQAGLLKWISHLKSPPKSIFLTHGDEDAATVLAEKIEAETGWTAQIPDYCDEVSLA
jgi:metallo-beta-lactamase family protein